MPDFGKAAYELRKSIGSFYIDDNRLSQQQRQLVESPRFEKFSGNPILLDGQIPWMGTDKLYFPSVVHMTPILGSAAIDNFYMYFSTDHTQGEGGIGLVTAPHPTGPWTDRGRVYVDTVDGAQTETPCVIWNTDTNKFHLYYHNNFWATGSLTYRSQATCLATSTDGVNWTRYANNPIVTVAEYEFPGDGHTGYARVYRVAGLWIMHHIMGGTNNGHTGVSYSRNGINWITDPRPFAGHMDYADTSYIDRKISICSASSYPFHFRGQLWTTFLISNPVSGGVIQNAEIYYSTFNNVRQPSYMIKGLAPGTWDEWDSLSISLPWVIEYENKLYMFYEGTRMGTLQKGFGVAISEV
jgi:hypothetical protein